MENNQTSIVGVLKDQLIINLPLATTLEDMSNELLMEIFELFDWCSLYFSFSSINSRFDAILAYCHSIQVDLDSIPSNKILPHLDRHLLSFDPHRIMALRSSINRHIKFVLCNDSILDHFSFICSLTLINIDQKKQ